MSASLRANVPIVRLDAAEEEAQYFEYTSSANPIGAGLISRVPFRTFPASSYASGPTRAIVLDLSKELGTAVPATGPGLRAHFLRVLAGERLRLDEAKATSHVFYVIRGRGTVHHGERQIEFGQGDFLALPGDQPVAVAAEDEAALYWVNDAPLLDYLGVAPTSPRFAPTRYPAARTREELQKVAADPAAGKRNRVSVLLANSHFQETRTITHVLWAMFGIVPPHAVQKAHRHQSIALDFIVDCQPGCYSMVGELDAHGRSVRQIRVDWEPGMAFVTPPGYWHAHHNESDQPALLVPIQDAGLHTYLRSLDIRFTQ